MEIFNLTYIDDHLDTTLERFLSTYKDPDENSSIIYTEITFDPMQGYESLLKDPKVKNANIIIIDDRLFENNNVVSGKFTGEEFRLVLKKYYPFIETIAITQNPVDSHLNTLRKYNHTRDSTSSPTIYYKKSLSPFINQAIENILIYRKLGERLSQNNNWEKFLKEKIIQALEGHSEYNELTKDDIDLLIRTFHQLQGQIRYE